LQPFEIGQRRPNSYDLKALVPLRHFNLAPIVKLQDFQPSVLSEAPAPSELLALEAPLLRSVGLSADLRHDVKILSEIFESFQLVRGAVGRIFC
jgi:hypothetical protein